MEITNGEITADLPARLAGLLIANRDWELADEADQAELDEIVQGAEQALAANRFAGSGPEFEESEGVAERNTSAEQGEPTQLPAVTELNNEAACDDDLPDGIVFADSAYEVVIDKETGEKVRVLKTHCRNGHEYAGANVKIRVRDSKAYRECQQCLKARRARANAKEKAQRAAK